MTPSDTRSFHRRTATNSRCRALVQFAIFILQFSFCNSPLWAASPYEPVRPDPLLESWRWRSFPELNGLGLRCLAEDRDGAIWFGTNEGVRRYDGVTWTVYTPEDGLLGAPVTALCATRDGSVYAGTTVGISRFMDGSWSRVYPPEWNLPCTVNGLTEASDGSVWAGTQWGALRLGREGAMLYTAEAVGAALQILAPDVRFETVGAVPVRSWPTEVRTGIQVTHGFIWAVAPGSPGEQAGLKVGDRITAVDGTPGVSQGRLNGSAGTRVKVRAQRKGRAEPIDVTLTRKEIGGTVREFNVYDVCEARDGALWFGLQVGEIVRYDPGAEQAPAWRLYTAEDGLEAGGTPRIAQTRDGTVWTVSDQNFRGVNRFDGETWTHFRLRGRGGTDINPSILETSDGTLWIGGHGGRLYAYRNGDWRIYRNSEAPIPTVRIVGLLEASDGTLWIAGQLKEVVRLENGTFRWQSTEGLAFQCETADGALWFRSQDRGIVRFDGEGWTRYGVEDGLMDTPDRLIVTREEKLWAVGSQDSTAATARFDGSRWSFQTHPRLSHSIPGRAVFESSDGALWFGGWVNPIAERGQLGGVLRFDESGWKHYMPPEAPVFPYGIGQTADGLLWFGGNDLRHYDGQTWTIVTEPEELSTPFSDVVYATPKGDLWVGTRALGVFHYVSGSGQDEGVWRPYGVRDGLADNRIRGILETEDGSVWVATEKGVSRFDGQVWTTQALPPELAPTSIGGLQQTRDGAIWINRGAREDGQVPQRVVRYVPDSEPPETEITLSLEEVSQPGNTTLAWKGADPWRETPDEELQFAWRLDGGEWSAFSREVSRIFQALPGGEHTFEVVARDRGFNRDPTPAAVHFRVIPPVWRQGWFVGLMAVVVGVVGFLFSRIVVRDRRLQVSNEALSEAIQELFGLNRELRQKTEDLETANRQIRDASLWKSQFLESMSHELRTPLNAILGFTSLVLRKGAEALPERQQENLGKVKLGGEYLLNLVDDILALVDIEEGRMELEAALVDVKDLIVDCCATVNPLLKSGVRLTQEVEEDVGQVQTDPARLRQIAINLLGYAVKFTGEGEVAVRVRREGEALVIAVSDTGGGIPADELDRVFDEFRQVEGSGIQHKDTGLGLSITKRLTELLGGSIGVESEVGKGSTFTARVPLVYRGEADRQV